MPLSPEEFYDQQILNESIDSENIYSSNPVQQAHAKRGKQAKKMTRCRVLLMNHDKQDEKDNEKVIKYFHDKLYKLNKTGLIFEWIPVYEEELEFYEDQDIEKFPTIVINDEKISGFKGIIRYLNNIINGPVNSNRGNAGQRATGQAPRKQKPVIPAGNGEDMKDYFMAQLNNNKDDADDEEDKGLDISKRLAKMNQARKSVGLHVGGTTGNPEVHDLNGRNNRARAPPRGNQARVPARDQYDDYDDDNDTTEVTQRGSGGPLSLNTMDLIKQMGDDSVEQDMMEKFWDNMEETDMDM